MVSWLDGDCAILTEKGSKPAQKNGNVDRWKDKQASGGSNDLHYLFSAFKIKPDNYPTLNLVKNSGGLRGEHRVLNFKTFANFALFTDEAPASEKGLLSIGEVFNGPKFTLVLLVQPTKTGRACLHAAGVERQASEWVLGTKEGSLFAEVGLPPRSVSIPLQSPDGYNLVFMERDNTTSTITISRGNPDYTEFLTDSVSLGGPLSVKLARLRLGRTNDPERDTKTDFEGNLAMVLIYDRALTDDDRKTIGTYVGQRYFGKPTK
jgi:hypothetical protein